MELDEGEIVDTNVDELTELTELTELRKSILTDLTELKRAHKAVVTAVTNEALRMTAETAALHDVTRAERDSLQLQLNEMRQAFGGGSVGSTLRLPTMPPLSTMPLLSTLPPLSTAALRQEF